MTARADDSPVRSRTDRTHQRIPVGRFRVAMSEVIAREGWQAAIPLIEAHWDVLSSEAPQQLLAVIRSLPGAAFVDRPTLLVAANYLQHVVAGGDPARFAGVNVVDAEMGGVELGLMDRLALLTSRAADARTSGDVTVARTAAEEARAILDRSSNQERAAILTSLPHMAVQWGRSLEQAEAPRAGFEYEEAYETALLTDQAAIARRAAARLAWLHAVRGRLNAAELWVARAADRRAGSGRYDGVIYITRALIHLDRDDNDGARRELALTAALGDGEDWAGALWVESMTARDAATATVIEARINQQLERLPERLAVSGANGRFIRASGARLAALRGRSVKASMPPQRDSTTTDLVIAGAVALAERRYHDATEVIQPATAADETPRVQSSALLVEAASLLALGQSESAERSFRQAHALIEEERIHTTYECIPPDWLERLAALSSVPPPHARSPIHRDPSDARLLSRREQEVLGQLDTDRSMAEIAAALYVSVNTVKSTVRRLYRKLEVDSRGAALDVAKSRGLF